MIPSPSLISIGICETQPVTAAGIRGLLKSSGEFEVQWAIDSLSGAQQLLRQRPVRAVLIDKAFGERAVMFALRQLREAGGAGPAIWGATLTQAEALRYLQAGALGLLRKTASPRAVLDCLRTVSTGSVWVEPPDSQARAPVRPATLTPREMDVLQLVEHGLRNQQIGHELGISPGTVKIHLRHIFEKTGIRGRFGLALRGFEQRTATPHPDA